MTSNTDVVWLDRVKKAILPIRILVEWVFSCPEIPTLC
jgi:hypothetical protein